MNARILIVDDEAAVLKIVTRFLVEAGYHCFTANTVKSAKQVLSAEAIELLLCDVKMPGESGLDLIRFAKENYPRVGRIMLTGIDSLEIANEIMSIGVYGYIVKPMTKNVVLITVANALRHLQLDHSFQASIAELEKKVSVRSEKVAAIMNNLTVGVVMLTTDMKILEINRQMQLWFPEATQGSGYFCYDASLKLCRVQGIFATMRSIANRLRRILLNVRSMKPFDPGRLKSRSNESGRYMVRWSSG